MRRCITFVICALCAASTNAATIHVPADQPTIQAGIDSASAGDTVLVADGTYTGDGNRDIDFGGKNIVLKSENGPEATVIDCEGSAAEEHRAFYFHSGESPAAVVEGFTIRGGYAYDGAGVACVNGSSPTITGNKISENTCPHSGGGIYCDGSSPVITFNTITNNTGTFGGGIAVHFSSNPVVSYNVFMYNTCYRGGGIDIYYYSYPTIDHNLFAYNHVTEGGGAIFTFWQYSGYLAIESCTMYQNISDKYGGGIFSAKSYVDVSKSILWEDSAGIQGAEIYWEQGGDVIVDSTDIYGGWPGTCNFDVDPLFCDTANGDFSLYANSPCAPDNNSCGIQIGAYGVGCVDMITSFGLVNEEMSHVVSHTPEIYWTYFDPEANPQDSFEVAVSTDPDWTVAEMWNPGPFFGSDTSIIYAGAPLSNGETYYSRLRAHNSVVWSLWYDTTFRMNSVPLTPSPLHPVADTITGSTPTLWIQNSTDAEGDTLVYDFFVAVDTTYGEPDPQEAFGVAEGADSTGWQVPVPLEENKRYWWMARAFDGYEYSDWTELFVTAFFVNAINEPPTAPQASYPPDTGGTPVWDMLSYFSWSLSSDPDPLDTVHYRLTVALDSNFLFAFSVDSIPASPYTLTDSLEFGEHYWWKVEAVDQTGLATESWNIPDFWTWTLGDLDWSHEVNVADLTYMVDYLFRGGPPIYPQFIGDINGDCQVNVADLTYLVAYLFSGGDAPKVGCASAKSQ